MGNAPDLADLGVKAIAGHSLFEANYGPVSDLSVPTCITFENAEIISR